MIGALALVALTSSTALAQIQLSLTERGWVAGGLLPGCVQFVAVAPSDPRILFAISASPNALNRSIDGGGTWVPLSGLPDSVFSVTVSPVDSATVYALAEGFYLSHDLGETWERSSSAPAYLLGGIVVDPFSPEILYSTGNCCFNGSPYFEEVWFSADEGSHWVRKDEGLPEGDGFVAVQNVVADPRTPGRLLLSSTTGVYVTMDRADHWSRISETVLGSLSGFDAASSDIVWARSGQVGQSSLVWRSADSGGSWVSFDLSCCPGGEQVSTIVDSLVSDPTISDTAYASVEMQFITPTFGATVLRTTDGGQTWSSFGDLDGNPFVPFFIRSLAIDSGGQILRAATCGDSNTVFTFDLRRGRVVPTR